MMQEWGGPLIGALLVGALIFGGAFLGMRHLRYDGPQARAEEDKRNTRLRWFADRVRAQMFRYEMGGRPEWGVMPTSASDGFGVGRRTEWNTAIRFQYRNHDVQAIDYTYWIHRRTRNRTRSIEYNKVFYEVRTPPWPLVQISSRYIHTFTGPGDQFPEITLGNEFDRWFRVHAEDERFARTLLQGPVLDFLMADQRCQTKWMVFQEECLWWDRPGKLDAAAVLRHVNPLIDIVDRLPRQAWQYRR
ncbi:hypothetical protein [Prauserella rugosa]|uniref:DUF3137 domain-containing protein n=1 Tax=Prauserella rugosa TaxID=43354 RepID=A0A660CIE2_9PSEU|nr:hypothetical protein [Prauserella rugosa]KMS91369.1 hypothetical protein ACZ91_09985 [Streptomyces regensis]TWH22194.1 hypothetical protein JD82_04071 [Prauserella rugosa]